MKSIWNWTLAATLAFIFTSCYDSMVNKGGKFNQKVAETYQSQLKSFYDNPETTPLKGEEKDSFKGITFFPVSEKYFVNAKVTTITNGQKVSMPTSAQKIKNYIEFCYLDFKINDQDLRLTAYVPEPNANAPQVMKDQELFVPFKDLTNSVTSYGAGRYIDLHSKDIVDGKIAIDFNRAYNPYCAYSIFYNCPIPPANNHLNIEIPAGVSYED